MKILYAVSEAVPFAKTGGLADVGGALPKALAALGHDVRVVMPCYASIAAPGQALEVLFPDMRADIHGVWEAGRVLKTVLPKSAVPIYLIAHEGYFGRLGLYQNEGLDYPDNAERFGFFCKAALWTLKALQWRPDVIVCNDWQTAMIPIYLRNLDVLRRDLFFAGAKVLFTIHNLAFQGLFDQPAVGRLGLPDEAFTMEGLEYYGKMNMLKGGIVYSDQVATVSPRYAEEIQTEEFGCGLEGVLAERADSLTGILNGIDPEVWSPVGDDLIAAKFSAKDMAGKALCKAALQKKCGLAADPKAPLIGVISRLTDQKGFDLIAEAREEIMALGAQFVLLGTGDEQYHIIFEQMAKDHPGQASATLGFDNRLAHEIEAGADMFLMPSLFEPCGLNQMFSLAYGAIPIVRKTGGLADSVENCSPDKARKGKGTGFVFEKPTAKAMMAAVKKAATLYRKEPKSWAALRLRAMAQDFSWGRSAKEYETLLLRMVQ